ncbi:MAG: VIT1/CCC1 transporter family protein [Candidatus Rokubacteria bacterium]|nr:VIT1/CCC1 transporter family protein [Candidatus Rokubacteria bacterium]
MMSVAHPERHFTGNRTVRDLVLGMADGLTVPFALAAGLTGAIDATWIIVVAGVAEIAAGAIAMGLGGYLAAKSDAEHYESERAREQHEVRDKPEAEAAEVIEVLESYGVKAEEAQPLVESLKRNPQGWVDFMMRFELGLERPDPRRALWSAVTIGGAYVAGGLIPLWPYMILRPATTALLVSSAVTLVALLVFGYVKGRFTGAPPVRSALQTALIGGLAASAAFAVARAIA